MANNATKGRIKSPSRKHSHVAYVNHWRAEITDKDFQKIEDAGQVKLSPELREALKGVLNNCAVNVHFNHNTPKRSEESKELVYFVQSLQKLVRFWDDKGSQAILAARTRIEDELTVWPTSEAERHRPLPKLVDIGRFRNDLSTLEQAADRAMRKFKSGFRSGRKGIDKDISFNWLSFQLKKIFEEAEGQKNAFARFFNTVLKFLPEDVRNGWPENLDSQRKRIRRK